MPDGFVDLSRPFYDRRPQSLRSASPIFVRVLMAAIAISNVASLPGYAQIIAKQENGRTIYVNAAEAGSSETTSVTQQLVYWSNTERRWKPVPKPSAKVMQAARSAASEVTNYIAAQPVSSQKQPNKEAAAANPNYSKAAEGRQVTAAAVDKAIERAAATHGVDPNLVRSIIKVESNFNPKAVSQAGAMGLMQLMPSTARGLNVKNPFDPEQNVDAGVRHFKKLLDNYNGDIALSLAAYNAGEGAVNRSKGVPPYRETRNYVERITQLYGSGSMNQRPGLPQLKMFRDADGVLNFSNAE